MGVPPDSGTRRHATKNKDPDIQNSHIPARKDVEDPQPVPSAWRQTLCSIVECLCEGDYAFARGIKGLCPLGPGVDLATEAYIREYGARLMHLPEDTWQTSVSIWYGAYWDVMVDLYTEEEGRSDMILHLHVYEEGDSFAFEFHMVYVP